MDTNSRFDWLKLRFLRPKLTVCHRKRQRVVKNKMIVMGRRRSTPKKEKNKNKFKKKFKREKAKTKTKKSTKKKKRKFTLQGPDPKSLSCLTKLRIEWRGIFKDIKVLESVRSCLSLVTSTEKEKSQEMTVTVTRRMSHCANKENIGDRKFKLVSVLHLARP